jgi:hypothetical protein
MRDTPPDLPPAFHRTVRIPVIRFRPNRLYLHWASLIPVIRGAGAFGCSWEKKNFTATETTQGILPSAISYQEMLPRGL